MSQVIENENGIDLTRYDLEFAKLAALVEASMHGDFTIF